MEKTPEAKVLVVDDDIHAVTILDRLLQKEGFEVVRALGGRQALDLLAKELVDVILLDVMMPEVDGFAVCTELQKSERTRHIPVILVTARDDMQTRAEGMKLGVSEFLTKPVNIRELYMRVRAQLHQRSIEQRIDTILTQ